MSQCQTCENSELKKYGGVLIGYCKLNLEQQYVKNWKTDCVFYVQKSK